MYWYFDIYLNINLMYLVIFFMYRIESCLDFFSN